MRINGDGPVTPRRPRFRCRNKHLLCERDTSRQTNPSPRARYTHPSSHWLAARHHRRSDRRGNRAARKDRAMAAGEGSMTYFGVTSATSVSPHAWQVQVSCRAPRCPSVRCGFDSVRRIAGSPHAGQGLPAVFGACASSAARRRSISSNRPGASRIRFHSGSLSRSARISERTANVAS